MKDISGKTIVITGATDGIGAQAAIMLSKENTLIIHGKDPEKGEGILEELRKINPRGDFYYFNADYASFREVAEMAEKIESGFDHIDILLNNAGIFAPSKEKTEDGFEKTFQVNYLSHFLFTVLLLNIYAVHSPQNIMNVSSMAHSSVRGKNFLGLIESNNPYDGYTAYSVSKACMILFSYHLSSLLKERGILVNCLHPGVIMTKLLKTGWPAAGSAYHFALKAVSKILPGQHNSSVEKGAMNVISSIALSENFRITGKYFSWGKEAESSRLTYDRGLQKTLWELSMRLTGTDLELSG